MPYIVHIVREGIGVATGLGKIFWFLLSEGGVRKVRKPQNRTKNNKKPQYRIEIYRNTETAGCRRQDLQSFYPLKIRPAVYADINSNVKLLNY